MQKIGTVKFVQIQCEPLKLIQNPDIGYDDRIYRTEPIQLVERLKLTEHGIIGIDKRENELIDVHNEHHPQSRYRGGNKISFGFIQQYERMRYRFDEHIKDGYAGENIIIDAEIDILNLNIQRRFFIKHENTLVELKNVMPAPPCRPFTVFCLEVPQCLEDIKAGLQFLDNGTRGYYAELISNDKPCFVQAGDALLVG